MSTSYVTIEESRRIIVEVQGSPSILIHQPVELVRAAGPVVGLTEFELRIVECIAKVDS